MTVRSRVTVWAIMPPFLITVLLIPNPDRLFLQEQNSKKNGTQSLATVQPNHVPSKPLLTERGQEGTPQELSSPALYPPSLVGSVDSCTLISSRESTSRSNSSLIAPADDQSQCSSPEARYLWAPPVVQEDSYTYTTKSLQRFQDSAFRLVNPDDPPISPDHKVSPGEHEDDDVYISPPTTSDTHLHCQECGAKVTYQNDAPSPSSNLPRKDEANRASADEKGPSEQSFDFDQESIRSFDELDPDVQAEKLTLRESSPGTPEDESSDPWCVWLYYMLCIACGKQKKHSKKPSRNLPCTRWRLCMIIIYRGGGLKLTTRWLTPTLSDVGDRIPGVRGRVIGIIQAIFPIPIRLRVAAFKPREGDVTARFWTITKNGKEYRKKYELAAWCLDDITEATKVIEAHTTRNAFPAFKQHIQRIQVGQLPDDPPLVRMAYNMAYKHFGDLLNKVRDKDRSGLEDIIEMVLLANLFILWFAMRNSTGSSWLHESELLDMEPCPDPTYPLGGKASLPRIITAQIDNVHSVVVLDKYRNRVMHILESLITRGNPRSWFIIFITIVIMLRESAWTSADRYRHARQNYGAADIRYTIPGFVQDLQEGNNTLLAYWNMYNDKAWPKSRKEGGRFETLLAHLTPEQFSCVKGIIEDRDVLRHQALWKVYKAENGFISEPPKKAGEYNGSQRKFAWDDPIYWIAQVVETDWSPRPTYMSEPMPDTPPMYEESSSKSIISPGGL
ncbi:hypothetical protein BGZ63DRAFT_456339 [Mariannaea sp. PMI_226]|nr:hypothetical protein BGZ63DRAFT_456339 [Mariannaea sp. PMI_226]